MTIIKCHFFLKWNEMKWLYAETSLASVLFAYLNSDLVFIIRRIDKLPAGQFSMAPFLLIKKVKSRIKTKW